MDIRRLVADFTERLHAVVDEISVTRARDAVMHALGEKRGRLPKGMAAILGRKPRRKGPRQLCPVPGCQNAAAPVFGMVCAAHQDVPKTKIKQYREARRAAKLGAKTKPGAKAGPKARPRTSAKGPERASSARGARRPKRAVTRSARAARKGDGATRAAERPKAGPPAASPRTAVKSEGSAPAPRPPAPSETAGAAL